MLFLIYFDGAPVPAIVTADPAYRPARDSLPWEVRTASGTLLDSYTPGRTGAQVIPFPQSPATMPAPRWAA